MNKQAVRGGFWVGVERFGQQGIQFFVSIVLARLLEPSEFGLVAMISIFTAFSTALINGGFASALIQKKDTTHLDESTVFWFNLMISILMVAVLWLAAPAIARFYDQPRLVGITRWSAFNLLIIGFAVVQLALLRREFLFKIRTVATIISVVVSGIVSAWMAFAGFGVWALVVQGLVMHGTMVLVVWVLHPWRPLFAFSIASFKSLFRFGSRLLCVGMMNATYQNLYQLIIGKLYTATDLGFFQRAKRFMMLCSYTPIAMITQVHFPYMCKIQDDPVQMKKVFSQSLKYSVMFTMPLLMGMMVVAPNFIICLIGEKWLPSVPYLRILCFTGVLFVIYMLNLDVIKARGYSGEILKFELFNRALLTLSIIVLFRYGISALLYGELICLFVTTAVVIHAMHKQIGAGLWVQLRWIAPCILSAVVMALVVFYVDIPALNIYSRFLVQVLAGVFAYFAMLMILRDREFKSLIEIVISKVRKIIA
ncbi:lipopolysaccharide biosynthesis protein [Pontiella sulfatireligans]|uniref:Teichuronic acid biosynthesis protein TuaB n=1 Tax=Pontiella sulfatireligans TaxID=2750658 RepID=A0A6C2UFP8_9BACT|nr:lipopolysaccharide biosynthesis protein [Pontiella sulfatireligans]VGO18261.1 Teichuronic acid biosynthesis protein TuaB [Pontiella sulfatireligans]